MLCCRWNDSSFQRILFELISINSTVSRCLLSILSFFSFYSFALSVRPCVFFNTHHVLSLSLFICVSSNLDLSAVLIFNLFLFWMLFRYVLWDTVKFMHGFGHIHHTSHRRIGPNIRFWMCSKLTTSGPIIYDIIRLIPIMLSIILWINQSILLLFAWLFDRLLNFFDHSNFLPCSLASFYSFSHSLSFLVQLTDSTHLPVCVYGFHRNEK